MKRVFNLIGLSIMLSSAAWAAKAPVPSDFLQQTRIDLEPGHAVYEFALTEAVYRSLQSSDISDLRVFNSQGKSVPHAIQKLPLPKQTTNTQQTKLPIFPLHGQEDQDIEGLTLHIEKNDKGSIVDLHIDDGANTKRRDNRQPIAYIVDASSLDRGIDHLKVIWRTAKIGRLIRVTVAASQDLQHWHTVAEDVPLATLFFQGHRLVRDTITLKIPRAKYLRLTWSKMNNSFGIIRVLAITKDTSQLTTIQYKWTRLSGHPDPDKPGAYRYDVGGHLPVHRIRVMLPDNNAAIYATIFSAARLVQKASPNKQLLYRQRHNNRQQTYWRSHHQGLIYDLEIEGQRLVSEDFSVTPTNDRYWRIVPKNQQMASSGRAPFLELGWVPEKLVFIAQGEPPFRLAYGSHKAKRAEFPMAGLLNMLSDKKIKPRSASITDTSYIGTGVDPDIIVMNVPLKRWILWGVLALGVGLLAWMAVRLFKQINAAGRE